MFSIGRTTKRIIISRGDTATLEFSFIDEVDPNFTYDGAVCKMSLKASPLDAEPIWEEEQTIANNEVIFMLLPQDTMDLEFGDYYWDLRLFFGDTGDVYTPIEPSLLRVTEVVGNDS